MNWYLIAFVILIAAAIAVSLFDDGDESGRYH
jgi:hypothetical protein